MPVGIFGRLGISLRALTYLQAQAPLAATKLYSIGSDYNDFDQYGRWVFSKWGLFGNFLKSTYHHCIVDCSLFLRCRFLEMTKGNVGGPTSGPTLPFLVPGVRWPRAVHYPQSFSIQFLWIVNLSAFLVSCLPVYVMFVSDNRGSTSLNSELH